MAKIILLNAPKGAGKDTIANAICERIDYPRKASFKAPMFQIALAIRDKRSIACSLMLTVTESRRKKHTISCTN
uniref:Uncharacterized protein n=1 Tax=Vibrio phage Vc1 TaxID=1480731 RepID=A0A6M5CER8_9CAUD